MVYQVMEHNMLKFLKKNLPMYFMIYIPCWGSSVTSSQEYILPDNKVHGANIGSAWVLSAPDGPHIGT